MIKQIKAAIKLLLLIFWILFSALLLFPLSKIKNKKPSEYFCKFSFSVNCFILGIKIKTEGQMSQERPLLLVSNHVSYLDIMILGAKTDAAFTPKSDMAKWPVVSTICRMLGCVFIERSSDKIKKASLQIRELLASGKAISLFPEGTTGNGKHLLPFKSSLLSIAEEKIMTHDGSEKELLIQPVIIRYNSIGALPIDSTQWPRIAWYGDMLLLPHLWDLLKINRIDASLVFLPPVTLSQFSCRKKTATYLHEESLKILQNRANAKAAKHG